MKAIARKADADILHADILVYKKASIEWEKGKRLSIG